MNLHQMIFYTIKQNLKTKQKNKDIFEDFIKVLEIEDQIRNSKNLSVNKKKK